MESFIKKVLTDLVNNGNHIQDLHFILPSKRAGTFLKREIAKVIDYPVFSPEILSIEVFVENLSGLRNISNTELFFKFYNVYRTLTEDKDVESFENFSKWGQLLLQDFNEIDRYLVDPSTIFDYLSAVKHMDHWSVDSQQTELIKIHLKFWTKLHRYYQVFVDELLATGLGYQGLIYREAVNNLEHFITNTTQKRYVFLGFNALNKSESIIIQGLLQNGLACIYWDIDRVFFDDHIHDAGLFTRQYKHNWPYFKTHSFNWVTSQYKTFKNIEVIGIPKLVGQAKYIGQILEKLQRSNKTLSHTAVVLGEENLLIPVLNSIPKSIDQLNITMGLPLKYVPIATLFELLFSVYKKNTANFYYKDVIAIITHPSLRPLLNIEDDKNPSKTIINYIHQNNVVYLSKEALKDIVSQSNYQLIDLLFKPWNQTPKVILENLLKLILSIKKQLAPNKSDYRIELEYLYRFNTLFNQLITFSSDFKYLNTINALHNMYKELLSIETLDFKGEPLEGLQIMGMLESRVLDFDTVIISSVNEGILPSGKSNNSFIPFDLKVNYGLPTYKEKDAVYTYHFYRLLQRAKNIYILYNTEVDTLKGGEKSRFITQLDIEAIHQIQHRIATPEVPAIEKTTRQISKTPAVISKIKDISSKGFSPSSLTNYIRNPIDFYLEKILKIKDPDQVEEQIAANTLGSVIHNTLEDFYKPLEGRFLTLEFLDSCKSKIKNTVSKHFENEYHSGNFKKGKNLIIFEIAQRYLLNFIHSEIALLKSDNTIKIIAIEADEQIKINIDDLAFPIKIKGKVDRIDELNGVTRVIDYKSGKVEQHMVEVMHWEDLTTNYDKYSKSFQVLCYAYMMYKKNKIELPIEAGIISFKNLKSGFLKFGKKEASHKTKKVQLISEVTLHNFERELKKLIYEICNPNVDFIEKKINRGQ